MPLGLYSDQGRNFESKLFLNLFDRLGIIQTKHTALHSQSDEMVEKMKVPFQSSVQPPEGLRQASSILAFSI